MSKHTPGPWNWTESNILMGAPRSPSDDSAVVLSACYDSEFEPDVSCMPADARLIAAAPELLAACEALVAASDTPPFWPLPEAFERARAAIAKVKP